MGVPYEGGDGYPSLSFLIGMIWFEIVLFLVCVGVLGISLIMFVRMFDALSPPTRALTWVVGADIVQALLLLAFMCFQMHYYARGEAIPDGFFCHYFNPAILALVVFVWLSQPVIAWMTLKTLRNEAVPACKLRRVFYACIAVAVLDYVWGVGKTPGRIVNGSFCIMKAKSQGQLDARIFANFVGLVSFVAAFVIYCKAYRHLKRLKTRLHRDSKKRWAHGVQKELESQSQAQASSLLSPSVEQRSPRRSRGPWEFDGAKGWGLVGAREGDVKAGVGLREENSHIAEEEFSGSDSDDSEGPPLTYEQLQERTQAARAAVNVLLPQQTDVMAGREGPYGKRRRERKGRLLEDGVDLSALLHPQEEPATRLSLSIPRGSVGGGEGEEAAAASSSSPSSGRGHRQDGTRGAAPQAEVIQLCEQAKRALIGRAVTLMTVYFLPVIILYFWLAAYKAMSNSARTPTISQFQKPPPVAVPFMALVFFLGAPLLQTFALLHLAVTIGRNILLFYQEYVDASSEENKSSGRSGALVSSAEGEGTASDGRGAAEGGAAAVAAMAVEGGVAVALGATAIRKPEGEGEEGAGVFLYEQQGVLPSSPPVVAADIPTLSPTPPPPAPLQPSAGGQLGKAGRALGRQRMQALSTIYEVAFKGRGAAAASLRPGSGGEGVGSGPSSAPSDSSDQQQGGDLEQQGAGTNSEPSSSEGERTLRRNSLVKEMLGVGVRRPFTQLLGSGSGSGSGGADGGGSGGGSDKQPSELEWDGNMTPAMPGGGERRSYGWQVESEVSSLTDFQDDYYQTGSLSLNPSPVRLARPGPSSLNPSPAAPMRPAAAARPSSLNPSPVRPSRTVFSPARFLRRSDASSRAVPAVPPATMPPGTAASASVLAPATRDSDAGRSIVTESEWREWQKRKDGNDDDN